MLDQNSYTAATVTEVKRIGVDDDGQVRYTVVLNDVPLASSMFCLLRDGLPKETRYGIEFLEIVDAVEEHE